MVNALATDAPRVRYECTPGVVTVTTQTGGSLRSLQFPADEHAELISAARRFLRRDYKLSEDRQTSVPKRIQRTEALVGGMAFYRAHMHARAALPDVILLYREVEARHSAGDTGRSDIDVYVRDIENVIEAVQDRERGAVWRHPVARAAFLFALSALGHLVVAGGSQIFSVVVVLAYFVASVLALMWIPAGRIVRSRAAQKLDPAIGIVWAACDGGSEPPRYSSRLLDNVAAVVVAALALLSAAVVLGLDLPGLSS